MKGLAINKKIVHNNAGMPDDYHVFLTFKGKLIKEYTMSDLVNRQVQDKDALPSIIYKDILSAGIDIFTYEQVDNFLQGK